ncbi:MULTISPECIES: cupin domain-containing protein [Bacillaceae]|uniref:Cupin type-2 domain-containing protein n=1 Tax=Domibacillus aminovorans TaxID=29332 RepID=A0A177KYB4_9BACI|nr:MULTISPECIES: cupin domain-containing protein [Bacillaceae]OAH58333.1 hypothetical protein AWH48_18330 [Domibacillus aminovorans]
MTKVLSETPGIQVFKAADLEKTFPKLDVSTIISQPGVNSQIVDVPVAETPNPLTLGFFSMQPGESFEFLYEVVEYKVVTKGKFVLRDLQGNRYEAEAGDVVLFTPNVPVIFDGESDGEAIYTAHRPADASFM